MGLACKISGHKWNGCTCTRCGKRRSGNHIWSAFEFVTDRKHKHTCTVCGRSESLLHTFEDHGNCLRRCTGCGYEETHHSGRDCICPVCGAVKEMPIPWVPVWGNNGSVITRRMGTPRETGHRGPWVSDPDNPCIIVCEACGKRGWDHDLSSVNGEVGTSAGGGATINFGDGSRCSRCGAYFRRGTHANGYCEDE